jgi:hypothetical protein
MSGHALVRGSSEICRVEQRKGTFALALTGVSYSDARYENSR